MTAPTTHPDVRMAPLAAEQQDALVDLDQWAFAYPLDEVDLATYAAGLEPERTIGAYVAGAGGQELAGIHATRSLEMPVPGGAVPTGGLTWVGVHPGWRRRGVLTAMMRHHLQAVAERGEPVSALFAAEPAIYGRYGYGLASRAVLLTLPRGAALRTVPGGEALHVSFEHADTDRHAGLLAACYDAARRDRPGWVSRPSPADQRELLEDLPVRRRGAESLRLLLVRDGGPDGELRGYAVFARAVSWQDGGPDGTVRVRSVVARDPATARELWARLTDLDLMARVETDHRALDDPLVHLLVDWRAARPRMVDAVWVRLVDVPAALAARRYARPVDVVIEVEDAVLPANARRWHLRGGPDGAACTPTDEPAALRLDVRELGAAYLGGESLAALGAAGLVQELGSGALHEAAAAFAWPVAPYCGWMF